MLTTKNEFRFQFMLPTKGLVIGFIADVKVLEDLFRMRGVLPHPLEDTPFDYFLAVRVPCPAGRTTVGKHRPERVVLNREERSSTFQRDLYLGVAPAPPERFYWNTLRVDGRRSCVGSFLKGSPGDPSDMTTDEKIRFGMLALAGASLVFASLGLKLGPLEIIGGYGTH
jgi:hypothetical protein